MESDESKIVTKRSTYFASTEESVEYFPESEGSPRDAAPSLPKVILRPPPEPEIDGCAQVADAQPPASPPVTLEPLSTMDLREGPSALSARSSFMLRIRTVTSAVTSSIFGAADDSGDESPTEGTALIKSIRVRVIEPTRHASQVRTEASIARLLFTKGSQLEPWIFAFGAKDSRYVALLWALWTIGAVSGFLIITEHIKRTHIWLCMGMLPLPLVGFMVLSKDLVGEVLQEMEYYIVIILEVVWLVCSMSMLGDERRLVLLCYFPSMVIAGLMDAYPAKYRAVFLKAFFGSSCAVLVAWVLMLMFSLCRWHNRTWKLGDIQGSTAGCTFTTSLTLLCFYGRHLYVAFVSPDVLVLVRSSIRTYIDEVHMDPEADDDDPSSPRRRFTKSNKDPRADFIKMRSSFGTGSTDGTTPREAAFFPFTARSV